MFGVQGDNVERYRKTNPKNKYTQISLKEEEEDIEKEREREKKKVRKRKREGRKVREKLK